MITPKETEIQNWPIGRSISHISLHIVSHSQPPTLIDFFHLNCLNLILNSNLQRARDFKTNKPSKIVSKDPSK